MSRDTRPLWAEIDLDALERNFREVERRVGPKTKILASIKADGYGHGVLRTSQVLAKHNIHALMTGNFEEAKTLRDAGVRAKIAMFGGCSREGIPELLSNDLIPTIYDMDGANAVAKAAAQPASVYVKVDSGLGRLGVPLEDAKEFITRISRLPNVRVECVYTHLPFFDQAGRDWAQDRLKRFGDAISALEKDGVAIPVTQARASSGVLAGLTDSCNAVCVGHLLYGLVPLSPDVADGSDFVPVLKAIKSRLIHIGRHRAGGDIAIGGIYGANRARVTGVVPIGLGDGLRALRPDRPMHMLVHGRRAPVVGISLEHTVLDLEGIDSVQPGDEVTILGADREQQITLKELAGAMNCGDLEVLMAFSGRLERECTSAAASVWGRFGEERGSDSPAGKA